MRRVAVLICNCTKLVPELLPPLLDTVVPTGEYAGGTRVPANGKCPEKASGPSGGHAAALDALAASCEAPMPTGGMF